MPIIDSSYFINERNIPNSDADDVSSLLSGIIAVREREFLIRLMGYELFKLFDAAVTGNSTDPKWTNILNGVEFTGLDSRLKKWEGFKNTTTHQSPIADYVYYYFLRNDQTQTSGNGEVKTQSENAITVSPARKQATAWNCMVDRCWILYEFLQVNLTTYTEFQKHIGSREFSLLMRKTNSLGI